MFAIPKTMRAVVYRGVNDLRLETVPVPRIGAHELLVKVAVCGVCPTDIKKIQHGTVPPPRIFGHETAGTIVRIGTQKAEGRRQKAHSTLRTPHSEFRLGDRVALHHHVPCLDCHYCRHRAYAQCETYKRTGVTAGFEPAGGGYAEYVRVLPFVLPGVVKIPARNSFEEGAMLEPVNTVLKAVRRLNLMRGDNVLVAGQGPIGLMFTRLLQLQGVNVLATDLLPARLRLARQFGAQWTFNPRRIRNLVAATFRLRSRPPAGVAATFRLRLPKRTTPSERDLKVAATTHGFDAAVVAVPSDAVVREALALVRPGGQVLLFAHTKRRKAESQNAESEIQKPEVGAPPFPPSAFPPSAFPLDFSAICLDEKDLIGSYSSDFTLQREVARLVFSRQLDVRRLITHYFPLGETAKAIALAASPTPASLKILVRVAR